jgi:hypothetical protein
MKKTSRSAVDQVVRNVLTPVRSVRRSQKKTKPTTKEKRTRSPFPAQVPKAPDLGGRLFTAAWPRVERLDADPSDSQHDGAAQDRQAEEGSGARGGGARLTETVPSGRHRRGHPSASASSPDDGLSADAA